MKFMTRKEIKKVHLENEKLYEEKIINTEEYIERQFNLLKEIRTRIHKDEQIDFEYSKKIKNWFRKTKEN